MYVLYCGDIALNDASSFTPGASGPGALSVSCYLIKHRQGWLLWDTGIPDTIASMPNGQKSNAGNWTSRRTLMKPYEIRTRILALSTGLVSLLTTVKTTEQLPISALIDGMGLGLAA